MNAPGQFSEQAMLGAVLIDPSILRQAKERLHPTAFELTHHRAIWRTFEALEADGDPIDTVTVIERLKADGKLSDVGGAAYIAELVSGAPSAVNWPAYASRINDADQHRRMRALLTRAFDRIDRSDDPNSVLAEHLDALQALRDSHSSRERLPGGLRAVYLRDVQPALTARYIVKGMLDRDSLVLLVGPSGSGKTFFAADLLLSIAAGLEWRGRRVRRGAVVYFSPENPRSMMNRAAAWCDRHETGLGLPFVIGPDTLNVRTDAHRMIELINRVRDETGESVEVVAIDTLSRAFGGGDENSAADMSAFVASCDQIRDSTGATIMVVHHTGKDSTRGARGSSALAAAADTVIEVADKVATVSKQRDAETGAVMSFRLTPVELGRDDDGDPVTTCTVEHVEATREAPTKGKTLSAAERNALDALNEVLDDPGTRRVAPVFLLSEGADIGQWVAVIADWRRRAYARMGDEMLAEAKRKQFLRSGEALQAKGYIHRFETFAWLR